MRSNRRVENKVALVTGAASGIGEATARLSAAEGATVIVSDVRLDAAETVAGATRAAGGQAEAVTLDVTDEAAWQSVMAGIAERHDRLDVLINNAGISVSKPIVEMTLDEWRKVMAVNLDGVFLGTKHAVSGVFCSSSDDPQAICRIRLCVIQYASRYAFNQLPDKGTPQ